jgi:hypothetical protein
LHAKNDIFEKRMIPELRLFFNDRLLSGITSLFCFVKSGFLKCLISIKNVQTISLTGGFLTPPCPTPWRSPVGRVNWDSVYFSKERSEGPCRIMESHAYDHGHQPLGVS